MKHRRGRNKLKFDEVIFFMVVIFVGAILIPASIFTVKGRPEREVYIEGIITEKNIERGFGSAYIFVLNGTTDISVYRWQYDSFSVGDYIKIYIVLLGYEIVRV